MLNFPLPRGKAGFWEVPMSTTEKKSETSKTEQKSVDTFVCVGCGKQFEADDDHVWLMPLKAIEAAIRVQEKLVGARWARPEDLPEHAMCGQCGHLVREAGGKTYRLSATLKMVVERKAAADAKRQAQIDAAAKAEREAATAKLGQLYDLKLDAERGKRGQFTGKKRVKVERADDADQE